MFESLLLNYNASKSQGEKELIQYEDLGLIDFLSEFSSPTISGNVTITPNHPDSRTGIEVVQFNGGRIIAVGSGGVTRLSTS